MHNLETADRLDIRAITINSTNTDDWPKLHNTIKKNEADALLISPERLANNQFVAEALLPISATIGLLVVDEAHCISYWGHDFRPDYRRLVSVLQSMPDNVSILESQQQLTTKLSTMSRHSLATLAFLRVGR